MKPYLTLTAALCLVLSSCGNLITPSGWPVDAKIDRHAVEHMKEHVKFTGSTDPLTTAEKSLLTFLHTPANIAKAAGKKSEPGAHEWSTAEIYRVDPGKHLSVLCENGYEQKAVYFHYEEAEKTWYRVPHLDLKHGTGVPAVRVP